MVITDCPWCDGPAVVTETLDCEGCGVTVEVTPDETALAQAA